MTWVKLSDDFATHPKVIGLSDVALRTLIESYCYAARHMTDGHLAVPVVAKLGTKRIRTELVDAGLWDTNGDGGVLIHDYLEYNPSRAEILAQKEAHAEQMREWRAAKKAKRDSARDRSRDGSRSPSRDGGVIDA